MRPMRLRVSIVPPIQHRHPGAVVAPVFQTAQTVEKDGNCLGFADVADDSAHKIRFVVMKDALAK